ncbi:MAG TPA: hypothetical protein VHR47_04885 [Bacillota bacterium]|nr:hypothetical protein [Bacillota bacterium]
MIKRPKIILMVLIIIVIGIFVFFPKHQVERSFYYWKTTFSLNKTDRDELNRLKVTTLYIRFFDVVWNPVTNRPAPNSTIHFKQKIPKGIQLIPTVFITNETLSKISIDQVDALAYHIYKRIQVIIKDADLNSVKEIQLDADWTVSTKDKYFALLRKFHAHLNKTQDLSVTIRLHQVKYRSETGVPPADRGILMFYNLESPAETNAKNPIFDLNEGKQYLSDLDRYPLALDLALPIYSWGAVYQGDRFIGLVSNLTTDDLQVNPDFQPVTSHVFVANANTRLRGSYVYKNDRIRIDESSPRDLIKASQFIGGMIRNRHVRVAIFHFDSELINRTGQGNINAIYRSFH